MLLYTLTKYFMEVQGYMLNPFGIILFYKVMGGQDIGVEPKRPMFNSLYQHILCEECILYIYLIHVCKCIVHRWVVNRQVGGHGG